MGLCWRQERLSGFLWSSNEIETDNSSMTLGELPLDLSGMSLGTQYLPTITPSYNSTFGQNNLLIHGVPVIISQDSETDSVYLLLIIILLLLIRLSLTDSTLF